MKNEGFGGEQRIQAIEPMVSRAACRWMGAGAAAAMLWPGRASAGCPLELVPVDAPGWETPVAAARERLAARTAHDCASVEVAVRPSGGALLTFSTTDGRRAVRALMAPEELEPTLDALLVTLPPEASPSGSPAPPAVLPSAAAESAPPKLVRSEDARPVVPVHFGLSADVGIRLGLPGVYAAPAIGVRPRGTFGKWELAAVAEVNPTYAYVPGGTASGFRLWAFGAGIQVGRREFVGDFAVGYGLGVGIASIHEDVDDTDGTTKVVDFAQPRLGCFGRVVWPRTAALRGTLELGLDVGLGTLKKQATLRNDVPELPRWGLLLGAGVETWFL